MGLNVFACGEDAYSVRLLREMPNPERTIEEVFGTNADETAIILALADNASGYADTRAIVTQVENGYSIVTDWREVEEAIEDGFYVVDLSGNRWAVL